MHLIQPCCANKHLLNLRNAIKNGGTAQFEGYGDLSLTELLPALLIRYSEVEMMIVAPSLPDQAAEVVSVWMRRQWSTRDGKGKLDAIRRLTVIADLSMDRSPVASVWLKENPFGGRMALVDMRQDSTAILLPDIAITGPVNMRYGHHFVATATTDPENVKTLWGKYMEMADNAPAEVPEETKAAAPKKPARKKRATKSKPKK